MTPQQLKDRITDILKEKKNIDLTVIDVTGQTEIADYMIILTGSTNSAVRALCEEIDEKLEKDGVTASRKEGISEGRWIVMDYSSVLVHIFNKETRGYYELEKFWGKDGNVTKIAD
jgi:ribosome-associated protein